MTGKVGTNVGRLAAGGVLAYLGKDVRKRARDVKAEDSASVFKYYMHMWNIFTHAMPYYLSGRHRIVERRSLCLVFIIEVLSFP